MNILVALQNARRRIKTKDFRKLWNSKKIHEMLGIKGNCRDGRLKWKFFGTPWKHPWWSLLNKSKVLGLKFTSKLTPLRIFCESLLKFMQLLFRKKTYGWKAQSFLNPSTWTPHKRIIRQILLVHHELHVNSCNF